MAVDHGFRLLWAAAPFGRCRRALLRAATNAHASLPESLSSRASGRRRLVVACACGPRAGAGAGPAQL